MPEPPVRLLRREARQGLPGFLPGWRACCGVGRAVLRLRRGTTLGESASWLVRISSPPPLIAGSPAAANCSTQVRLEVGAYSDRVPDACAALELDNLIAATVGEERSAVDPTATSEVRWRKSGRAVFRRRKRAHVRVFPNSGRLFFCRRRSRRHSETCRCFFCCWHRGEGAAAADGPPPPPAERSGAQKGEGGRRPTAPRSGAAKRRGRSCLCAGGSGDRPREAAAQAAAAGVSPAERSATRCARERPRGAEESLLRERSESSSGERAVRPAGEESPS